MDTMRNIDFRILAHSAINAITLYVLNYERRNRYR